MKYFIDLDNTLCLNKNSDYTDSKPILERIRYVNELKKQGNNITIWTIIHLMNLFRVTFCKNTQLIF